MKKTLCILLTKNLLVHVGVNVHHELNRVFIKVFPDCLGDIDGYLSKSGIRLLRRYHMTGRNRTREEKYSTKIQKVSHRMAPFLCGVWVYLSLAP